MRSREDWRRIVDPCTIVHAHEHKSMCACTEAYYGGQCAYSYYLLLNASFNTHYSYSHSIDTVSLIINGVRGLFHAISFSLLWFAGR